MLTLRALRNGRGWEGGRRGGRGMEGGGEGDRGMKGGRDGGRESGRTGT